MNETKKKTSLFAYLCVLAIYLAANMNLIMNPAIPPLAEKVYTDSPYSTVMMIGTVLTFAMVPANLGVGALIGRKLKYKSTALIGMILILVGGVGPFFVKSLPVVIFLRAVLGFGQGVLMPMQGALVQRLFPEDQRASALGFGGVVMSASAVIYQLLSGWLAEGNPVNAYLIHGFIIASIVIMLGLKEPEPLAYSAETTRTASNEKIPARVYFCSFCFIFVWIFFYPALMNLTGVLTSENLGTASTGGLISSLYTVGGIIGGAIIGKLAKVTGRFAVPIGLASWVGGTGLLAYGRSVPIMILGAVLCGIGLQTVWPGTSSNFLKFVPASRFAFSNSIFTTCMCIGCFLCSYFVSMVTNITGSTDYRTPGIWGFWGFLIVGVVWSAMEILRPADKLAK